MRSAWLTTVGQLMAFLEKEIAAGRNPRTPEEWDDLMHRMRSEGKCNKFEINKG